MKKVLLLFTVIALVCQISYLDANDRIVELRLKRAEAQRKSNLNALYDACTIYSLDHDGELPDKHLL